MELKKNPEANLENKRNIMFQIGLVFALALVLVAFEWKTFETHSTSLGQLKVEAEEEELIPITQQELKKPPPPPPKVTMIEIVENDEKVEETEINETEITEDLEIEVVETNEEEVNETEIFTIVEQMPAMQGCESGNEAQRQECTQEKVFKYLANSIKYPPMAKDANISGIVYVNFVINGKGKVKDPKILKGIGGGCDEEALRVIKQMPSWVPGKQRGRPVNVSYNLPIRFTLK